MYKSSLTWLFFFSLRSENDWKNLSSQKLIEANIYKLKKNIYKLIKMRKYFTESPKLLNLINNCTTLRIVFLVVFLRSFDHLVQNGNYLRVKINTLMLIVVLVDLTGNNLATVIGTNWLKFFFSDLKTSKIPKGDFEV
jgi:thiamine pyrophosphokinase